VDGTIKPGVSRLHTTRQRLISTAMQLFREKGYTATSVADLLKAADASSGSLYNFFPGKRELLLAVLEVYRDRMRETLLDPAWRGVSDPIEKIFRLLAMYRQLLVETDGIYGCPVGSLALELHAPDPTIRDQLGAYFTAWTDAIHECLIEAGSRLRGSVDRLGLAEFVLTTMEGAVMQARTFRDVGYFDRAVDQLRDYFDFLLYDRPALLAHVRQALPGG
jgi:TetR/AcrR family transcriptional regulator, transcriptional repressor for nem operon